MASSRVDLKFVDCNLLYFLLKVGHFSQKKIEN